MSTRTQSLLLLLFGAALLRLGTSDVLLRFVKPSARPWVLVAAVAMLVLAIWSLVVSARSTSASDEHAAADGHGTIDEHGHGASSRVAWLIVAPVIAVLVIGPPALGQYTANRRDPVVPVAADQAFGRLPDSDPVRLRVFDFALRAVGEARSTLHGRTVQLTGFVARTGDGGFTLARLVITCCAADASPITVAVSTDVRSPGINSWVRVTGHYAGQDPHDPDVPRLAASSVRTVAAPSEPYD